MAEFRNPQNEPGMEKRLLLVFALTFLVIVLFQPLLKKYLPQPPTSPAQNQQQAQPQPQAPPPPAPANNPAPAAAQSKTRGSAPAMVQAAAESETIVENDLYRITFSNHGGLVKSWVLKKYDDEKGQPLDLVNSAAAAKYGYPLSLWTYDETLRNKLNSALYVLASDHMVKVEQIGAKLTAPADFTFEYADQDVTVRKTFHFDNTYVVRLETSVIANEHPIAALPAWPAGFGDQTTLAGYHSGQIEYQYNNETQRLAIKKISGGNTLRGPFDWAGVTEPYFAALFLPDDPQGAHLILLRNSVEIPKDPQKPSETTPVDVLGVAMGNPAGTTRERIYAGPKSLQVLESVPVPGIDDAPKDLRSVVDFGFFGVIARPLFIWLRWTYQHWIPNWGWALVLQTLIIAVALLPLRITQMKSALKMQKVGSTNQGDPREVQEIQHARSAQAGYEQGDFRVVQAGRRKPGGRLSAHAHSVAVSVGLLQDAGQRHRSAPRALALDPRSLVAGSVFHTADRHGHQHDRDSEDDPAGRHGPLAAKDDDLDHAIDDGLHLLSICLRA